MWMGIIQSTEGQNRTEKAEKGKIMSTYLIELER